MQDFQEWIQLNAKHKPWLLLGKGPSLSRIHEYNTEPYVSIALNDVALEIECNICHIFDLPLIEELAELWKSTSTPLLVPEFLNESYRLPFLKGTFHRQCNKSVKQLVDENKLLKELDTSGRLYYYPLYSNASTGAIKGSFSAATVTSMLAYYGASEVRTLGIDGGEHYAEAFDSNTHLLEAGQLNFNSQFIDIAKTLFKSNLNFGPLDMKLPVKIFVGTQREQKIAFEVLKYSIEKHASISVEVLPLNDEIEKKIPEYAAITAGVTQGTPFSLQRFCIPELCDYVGRAIYVDSDMQVFEDIRELASWTIAEDQVYLAASSNNPQRAAQISVLLIDCEKAHWDIREITSSLENGITTYEKVYTEVAYLPGFARELPFEWNSLETFEKGRTKLLHYTNMNTQPWLSVDNPLAAIWCEELREAMAEGYISECMLSDHVQRGWIRPSLEYQIREGIDDPILLPETVISKDQQVFVPPHQYGNSDVLKKLTGYGKRSSEKQKVYSRLMYARIRYYLKRMGVYNFTRDCARTVRKVRSALSTGFRFGL